MTLTQTWRLPARRASALPGVLFTADETRFGWTIGGGIEYMFLPNWSAKIEYDYYGFPDKSITFNGGSGNSFTEIIKQNMQIATVGLNYHFGAVAAAPAPPAPYITKAK